MDNIDFIGLLSAIEFILGLVVVHYGLCLKNQSVKLDESKGNGFLCKRVGEGIDDN